MRHEAIELPRRPCRPVSPVLAYCAVLSPVLVTLMVARMIKYKESGEPCWGVWKEQAGGACVAMSAKPFVIGSKQPLLKGFVLTYAVSGQPLEAIETVQVLIRLPYCLYVPSTRYVFNFPDDSELVGVVPQKVWTKRAEGSVTPDSEVVAPNQPVYLDDSELITDWMGQPEPFTGELQARNMEFDKDPNGYFRYTRLTLEFDWHVPCGYDPSQQKNDDKGQENTHQIIAQISTMALPLVNHFVDVYRIVTDDIYLERIPVLIVEDIRVGIHDDCSIRKHEKQPAGPFTYKYGYHPRMLGMHGIRPAMVSKPKEVVDSFRSLLESSFRPPTDELLRHSALAALERHDAKLAVIESFISLEVYVERFYYDRLSETMTSTGIEDLLGAGDNWRIVVRLKELLRQHFGKAISDINNGVWSQWIKKQQQRHGIVHRNLIPSEDDAQHILQLNESIKRAMETL